MSYLPILIFNLHAGEGDPRERGVIELAELCGTASARLSRTKHNNCDDFEQNVDILLLNEELQAWRWVELPEAGLRKMWANDR